MFVKLKFACAFCSKAI